MSGWPTTGEVPTSERARVWISPERARWAREEKSVVEELRDGAVIVELPFGGHDYLAREILKEAGDAAVSSPRRRARRFSPPQRHLQVRSAAEMAGRAAT